MCGSQCDPTDAELCLLHCTFWLFCCSFRPLRWKATMAVTCLRGSPLSPRNSILSMNGCTTAVILNGKDAWPIRLGLRRTECLHTANGRELGHSEVHCRPSSPRPRLTPSANLSNAALPVNKAEPTSLVKKELAECI